MPKKKLNIDEESPTLNPANLTALAGGKPPKTAKLCVDLMQSFIQFQPSREELFRKALMQPESKDLSELAHTMRIEAETLGAERLVELFQDLEWQAENAGPEALTDLVNRINDEMRLVCQKLGFLLK